MKDPRFAKLAELLVKHSTRVKPGEKVLIEATCIPGEMLAELACAVIKAGGIPIFNEKNPIVNRKLLMEGTLEEVEARMRYMGELELHRMKQMDAYISLRGADNISENADVPANKMELFTKYWQKPVLDERVANTKWVVLRWPNPAMAQQAGMSTEAFEDYYFSVCLADYEAMAEAVKPLIAAMEKADKVHIVGPGTDLRFSIKDIGVIPCYGLRNIPDGECYTAPVRNSVNGVIQFNTPTIYQGVSMEDIRLVFKDGKVIEATSSDTEGLNRILDTDEGARYLGEFALGFNPNVTKPMRDTLFDEKICGSLHLALGRCYEAAPNGNESSIHWDNVLIQVDGGEVWFDDVLIRKDGIFVIDELKGLNPDRLK
ncbi:MAG: aminopeptidase [bacterium]|nr:aminopeptidase [bacterium]